MDYGETLSLERIIQSALAEDLGAFGDTTSKALFDPFQQAKAVIKSKDAGVLSGVCTLEPIFHALDARLRLDIGVKDGCALEPGARICTLQGPITAILAGERLALNFLQRLSGIATATARLARLIAHTNARLLDTRKTTPLLRALEKRAVRDGGGRNHRFGLFDMILIKDTHVKAAGGPAPAIERARRFIASMDNPMKIEVEVQTREEFAQAIGQKPDRVMLDNMDIGLMTDCVRLARSQAPEVELEASGSITAETIVAVAQTGVDFISCGAITHSVKALDIHLVIEG